jgi:small subunit ribosomal protein S20
MPITKSAKKALRGSKIKKTYNDRRKSAMRGEVKKINKLVKDKKLDEAKKSLSLAYQAIDKAAKNGVIKKNAASRKKSRLTKMLNKKQA